MLSLLKRVRKKDYLLFGLAAIFIVLQVYAELKVPELFANLIDEIIKTEQAANHNLMWPIALEMLAYIGLTLLLFFVVGLIMAKFSSNVSKHFRQVFFAKVMGLSYSQVKDFSPSSLLTRTTNDITNVESFFSMGLRIMITAPITAVMAIGKILKSNFSLAAGTIAAVLFLVVVITILFTIAIPKFKKMQGLIDKINASAKETLTGLKDIRAFNNQNFHTNRYEHSVEQTAKVGTFIDRAMALLEPLMIFVVTSLILFIYWFGAHLASQNLIDIGQIMAFGQYALMVLFSLTSLTFVFIMIPRASVSAKRINQVLKIKKQAETNGLPANIKAAKQKQQPLVEFKNVWFSYPNAQEEVIKNISFKVYKGETIAFIGATGSGKSTIVNLLARLYEVTQGEILLNGQNIKNISKKQLLSQIAYVSQKALLFKGTVRSNLTIKHKNATDKELKNALEIAQAKNFVLKDKQGLDAQVAQGGGNFSGGQKQRLCIARAIVKPCDIMIFDDSFSALDFKTDKAVRLALAKKHPNATKFIVAQRVGTIINANKIVVLENGKAVGVGTHDKLLKTNKIYKQIVTSQLGEEGQNV